MTYSEAIGEVIRLARVTARLSQRDLAKRAGYCHGMIRYIEEGRCLRPERSLCTQHSCEALGIPWAKVRENAALLMRMAK